MPRAGYYLKHIPVTRACLSCGKPIVGTARRLYCDGTCRQAGNRAGLTAPATNKAAASLRFAILERDKFRCRYCGAGPDDDVLELDHIVPVSKGGQPTIDNLVTACRTCNIGKGTKILRNDS